MKLPPLLALLSPLLLAACAHPHTAHQTAARTSCDQARIATLPFTTTGEIPTIEASVDGTKLHLALSGNGIINELAPQVVERLNLPSRQMQGTPAAPGAKPPMLAMLRIPQLNVGGAHFANLTAVRLARARSYRGSSLDGALAINGLTGYSIDFDVPQQRLSLYRGSACNSATYPFPDRVLRVNMEPDAMGRPVIPVMVNGRSYTALLDPSLPGIAVSAAAAGLSAPADARPLHNRAGGPDGHVWLHSIDDLRIGPDRLRNFKALVFDRTMPPGVDVLIGFTYFRARRVVLSIPDRRVYIAIPPRAAPPVTQPEHSTMT
jgi:hypothetical protein